MEIWISCSNDVMYHVDCVIKRNVYPLKCIRVLKISVVYHFSVLKISVVYQQKYIIGVIALVFRLLNNNNKSAFCDWSCWNQIQLTLVVSNFGHRNRKLLPEVRVWSKRISRTWKASGARLQLHVFRIEEKKK